MPRRCSSLAALFVAAATIVAAAALGTAGPAAAIETEAREAILIDPVAYTQPLPRIIKFASGGFGGFMAQISSPRFLVKKNIKGASGKLLAQAFGRSSPMNRIARGCGSKWAGCVLSFDRLRM